MIIYQLIVYIQTQINGVKYTLFVYSNLILFVQQMIAASFFKYLFTILNDNRSIPKHTLTHQGIVNIQELCRLTHLPKLRTNPQTYTNKHLRGCYLLPYIDSSGRVFRKFALLNAVVARSKGTRLNFGRQFKQPIPKVVRIVFD